MITVRTPKALRSRRRMSVFSRQARISRRAATDHRFDRMVREGAMTEAGHIGNLVAIPMIGILTSGQAVPKIVVRRSVYRRSGCLEPPNSPSLGMGRQKA